MKMRVSRNRPSANSRHAALRRALLRRREELLQGVERQFSDVQGARAAEAFSDFADQATDSLYDVLATGVAEIASADLRRIDLALEKLGDSTYGQCEDCGRRIPAARLKALPFAHLCVECKRREEDEATRPAVRHARARSVAAN